MKTVPASLVPKCNDLIARLARPNGNSSVGKTDVGQRMSLDGFPAWNREEKDWRHAGIHLGRGFDLLLQAGHPFPECNGGREPYDVAREAQWRILMWQAGFEQIKQAWQDKVAKEEARRVRKLFANLLGDLGVNAPNVPGIDRRVPLKYDLFDFFKQDKHAVLPNWAGGKVRPHDWTGGLQLAEDVRNATAHGALTPNKILELDLEPGLQALLDGLIRATDAIDQHLARRASGN